MWLVWTVVGALAGAPPDWEALAAADGWTEVATRRTDVGAVQVLHRRVGALHCLQGVSRTDLPPDALVEVAADIPSALRWSTAGLTASRVLAERGGGVDYYQHLDVPDWTLATDRYWVAHGAREDVGQGGRRFRWLRVEASAYPALQAEIAAGAPALEVPVNWGEWVFSPGGGGTEVRYRVCTDSGGALPAWLQKLAAQRTLPDTVADLVREAGRRAR